MIQTVEVKLRSDASNKGIGMRVIEGFTFKKNQWKSLTWDQFVKLKAYHHVFETKTIEVSNTN